MRSIEYEQGMDVALARLRLEQCPYRNVTKRDDWISGWWSIQRILHT